MPDADNDGLLEKYSSKIVSVILVIIAVTILFEILLSRSANVAAQQQTYDRLAQDMANREKADNSLFNGRGYLSVYSIPTGAEVWVNGVLKGNTPLNLPGHRPGPHDIELKHPMTESLSFTISVRRDAITKVNKNLSYRTMALQIDSTPQGAEIKLDGNKTDKRTPATITTKAGRHHIALSLAGYGEYDIEDQTFTAIPDQATEYHAQLEPLKDVMFDVRPSGQVKVLNRDVEYQPFIGLPVGEYEFLISENGFESQTIKVDLQQNHSQVVQLKRKHYQLQMTVKPATAKVQLSHKQQTVAWQQGQALPSGTYSVDVTADGYKPKRIDVHLLEDKHETVTLEPDYYPEFALVTGDSFYMGGGNGFNSPSHRRYVDSFYLGKTEVTNQLWKHCSDAGVCRKIAFAGNDENKPVVGVSWRDIEFFIGWLNKGTGKDYRLPTEAEWEYVARAQSRVLRYGSACQFENFHDSSIQKKNKSYQSAGYASRRSSCNDKHIDIADVAQFKPNQNGVYDLLGNVREWVADCWHANYNNAPVNAVPWLAEDGGDCSKRLIRGKSWMQAYDSEGYKERIYGEVDKGLDDVGFRLAMDLRKSEK